MSATAISHYPDNFSTALSNNPNNNPNNNINNKNNNNIIIIRNTEPGVSEDDAQRIVSAYVDAIGSGITAQVARMLESFLQTHTVEHLLAAIERTSWAPRPSPQYLRAVLRNYDTYQYNRPQQQQWWQQNPALQYDQREYRDEDFSNAAFLQEVARLRAEDERR